MVSKMRLFSEWLNFNIYMVLNHKMISEPLNCGLFLNKFYLRLHENGHKISQKIVY